MLEPDIAALPPAQCPDMSTLRAQIDRIDRALVALIAERTGYIARAAEIKQQRAQVHDEARIEDVVAKVRAAAATHRLPPTLVDAVWRTLIAQSIAVEFKRFDERANSAA
jgi:isochorismate pyruvate lyase